MLSQAIRLSAKAIDMNFMQTILIFTRVLKWESLELGNGLKSLNDFAL